MSMAWDNPPDDVQQCVREILGYFNYSSGTPDPQFSAGMNRLFGWVDAHRPGDEPAWQGPAWQGPAWQGLGRVLREGLDRLRGRCQAFAEVGQAEAVLRLVFDHVLGGYRDYHKDILFHQSDETLFTPFFIVRVCEAVLAEGKPWDESDRIAGGAIQRLNDFVGYRPVAVLHTRQKLQPYPHERIRPIPLFIRGAGVAVGRYGELIEETLDILRTTDPSLLRDAWFDLELLEELAVDPRAYDFDHPVHQRPNHLFGQWDPHLIDNRGYYRRFVLQEVTLEAVWSRLDADGGRLPRPQVLTEAAAVLAGTILMGSGISGDRPEAHDSSTTLSTLLPHIAGYRDAFYEHWLRRFRGDHGKRLRSEAAKLHQPFGAARQHLNQLMAQRRANQLQHVHLAELFARMGHDDAALRRVNVVPVASARMRCEMRCCMKTVYRQLDRGRLDSIDEVLRRIVDLLHRAIECGAMVDPWNILGFDAQFSIFPAVENSMHDPRVDELIELMEENFALYARAEHEAAAVGNDDLRRRLSDDLGTLGQWWDQFATTEVASVSGISGREAWESADHVATALGAWHEADTGGGDVGFWREHVGKFNSPKAYALVVDLLLTRHDPVASMALLMQWLSQSENVALVEGRYSFHDIALRWMKDLWGEDDSSESASAGRPVDPSERWSLTRKFMDYIEAGSEELWEAPRLELSGKATGDDSEDGDIEDGDIKDGDAEDENIEDEDAEDEPGGLFGAAYENVTYRDSTDDGFDGEILDGDVGATDFKLSLEAERITRRLAFLLMIARLWKLAAGCAITHAPSEPRDDVLAEWSARAMRNHEQLLALLEAIHRYRIPPPSATSESLLEYDRRQAIKELLLDRTMTTCLEMADAGRVVLATSTCRKVKAGRETWDAPAGRVLRALYAGRVEAVRKAWDRLCDELAVQPLLYLPLSRGGSPRKIVAARGLHCMLRRLLAYLPRLGRVDETLELLVTIEDMERDHSVGSGAITEFDKLFEAGFKAIVHCVVAAADAPRPDSAGTPSDAELIELLEEVAEPLLFRWLRHSRNIRFSVLEVLDDARDWTELKKFITRYGHDLFTQSFMNFGNLRAILHQGTAAYLRWLEEKEDARERFRLLDDLDVRFDRDKAAAMLEFILEAVTDYYPHYLDYNVTTTQSDRGEMLYTLLDFLRLVSSYDRVAWNLQPLVLAHEVLVRTGRAGAADLWRRAIAGRTADVADEHLQRYQKRTQKHGMRLATVAERLGERFVQPLVVDQLRARVRPAVEELRDGRESTTFTLLETEIDHLAAEPSGIGLQVPSWLEALEKEARHARHEKTEEDADEPDPYPHIPQVRLTLDEIRRQIRQ
jgi:hypothetical protein